MMDSAITRYQGVEKQSAGYRLLTGMGWKEGEGLGATKQGIKEHIRVKKKFENWGVGAVRVIICPYCDFGESMGAQSAGLCE